MLSNLNKQQPCLGLRSEFFWLPVGSDQSNDLWFKGSFNQNNFLSNSFIQCTKLLKEA